MPERVVYISVAIAVWWLVDIVCTYLAARLSRTFVKYAVTEREKGRWRSRFISIVHAVYGTAAALYVIFTSAWDPADTLYDSAPLKLACLGGSVGYFIFDTVIMLIYKERDKAFYVHHLVVGGGMALAMASKFCAFAFVAMTVNEMTTPMLNFAWIMQRMKMTQSRLFVANGIALSVGFFAVRICFNIYIAVHYLSPSVLPHFPAPIGNVEAPLYVQVIAVFFFPLYFLYLFVNIYWFGVLLSKLKAFLLGTDAGFSGFDTDSDLEGINFSSASEDEMAAAAAAAAAGKARARASRKGAASARDAGADADADDDDDDDDDDDGEGQAGGADADDGEDVASDDGEDAAAAAASSARRSARQRATRRRAARAGGAR